MDPRLAPLAAQLDLDARLLLNCTDDLTDAERLARPAPTINSPAFLVAHLVESRHYLLDLLGHDVPNPVAPYVGAARSMAEVEAMPAAGELRAAWIAMVEATRTALADVDAARLDAPVPQRLPGSDGTLLGAIAFLLQHESYHVGQLALMRRLLGRPAMRYD
jgi:uncharacterized damage-inducible protein DinB